MNGKGARNRFTVAVFASSLGIAGCVPLPIPHVQQVTPRVAGRVHNSAGKPSSAVQLALTAHDKDTTCLRPSVRAVTDSTGAFQVPFVEERKSIYWFTLMENPARVTQYWLCTHAADDSGAPVYQARTEIMGHLDGDTLECLDWSWNERRRIVCNTAEQAHFLVGGTWVQGADTGFYRIILADEDKYGSIFRGYVQWVARPGAGRTDSLHAMVELPVGPELAWEEGGPTLVRDNGTWYLTALSRRRSKWNNNRWLRFELGPPGEVREVPVSRK
jgi:hypothetical protein